VDNLAFARAQMGLSLEALWLRTRETTYLEGAKAARSTLPLLAGALALGAVILFPSFGYLYWVFKARPGRPATRHRSA
jgi:hypothetical protein